MPFIWEMKITILNYTRPILNLKMWWDIFSLEIGRTLLAKLDLRTVLLWRPHFAF